MRHPTLSLLPSLTLRLSLLDGPGGIGDWSADQLLELEEAFHRGGGSGLLLWAALKPTEPFAAPEAYWRDLARLHLTRLVATGRAVLTEAEVQRWPQLAPPLPGGEYLSPAAISAVWEQLAAAAEVWQQEAALPAQELLARRHPAWETLGRVCLSLAEHSTDAARPFALMATYTTRLALSGKPQHTPLGRALKQMAEAGQEAGVARIGAALQCAAAHSPSVRGWLADRRLFSPQALTAAEAHGLLRDCGALEQQGLLVRVPAWWDKTKPPRPRVEVELGAAKTSGVGIAAMLDVNLSVVLHGHRLSPDEWKELKKTADGLVLIRGQWVEVDQQRLQLVLEHWEKAATLLQQGGLSFTEALRLIHKFGGKAAAKAAADSAGWAEVRAGPWLSSTLASLQRPEGGAPRLGQRLKAELRPYQRAGLAWLWLLNKLSLGGCLADDMGLGKTIQVLALFAALQEEASQARTESVHKPHLLVAPATLVGNWLAEARRFVPSLRVFVAHPSMIPSSRLRRRPAEADDCDLVVTSYGAILRYPWLRESSWSVLVLDEAQAIKNPQARQTLAVKSLQAAHRLALTGTPVENKPLDLWSLFDFLNPGLLGSAKEFQGHLEPESDHASPFAAVRALVKPYLLRRLKSDKSIIADLPPKTEVAVTCGLAPPQAALYARIVDELKRDLKTTEGIQRKGAVLSALLRLKQVCDHPALLTGEAAFTAAASGKLQRLLALASEIAERQERLLVFTQFRPMTEVLHQHLTRLFGRPGCLLHGETPVAERQALVQSFQRDDGPPFFVLSVKAGGTGLTLTAASHVVHFDRWWNPAVEDQATDRAYRIGQKNPVLVHKFVCAGTIEARIAALLQSKKGVAQELLVGGAEVNLTELGDEELLAMLSLDLKQAQLGA